MVDNSEFRSLLRLSRGIAYIQKTVARVSSLLLMFGLVVATANLLQKDAVFGGAPWLQGVWAWAQAVAVDANLGVIFASLLLSYRQRDWVRTALYLVTGISLVFVAFVITDLEEVRQALNTTLAAASLTVHIPIDLLTQVRAGVVVGLVALGGIDLHEKPVVREPLLVVAEPETTPDEQPPQIAVEVSPPSLPALEVAPVVVVDPVPKQHTVGNGHAPDARTRVAEYLSLHPHARGPELEHALRLPRATVNKWAAKIKEEAAANGTETMVSEAELVASLDRSQEN